MSKFSDEAGTARAFRQKQAYEALFFSQRHHLVVKDKWALHDHAAEYLGVHSLVTYLEFGVADGDSLRRTAARFKNPETRLIGFDSFFGLPEDWSVGNREERIIPKGHFTQEGKPPQINDQRVSYLSGWFQNTVPSYLANRSAELAGRKLLIHFDADLYSSTLFLLSSLWPHVSEYFFIMDDFGEDDLIALHDFVAAYPVELEWVAHCGEPPRMPSPVFGRVKRVAFQL